MLQPFTPAERIGNIRPTGHVRSGLIEVHQGR